MRVHCPLVFVVDLNSKNRLYLPSLNQIQLCSNTLDQCVNVVTLVLVSPTDANVSYYSRLLLSSYRWVSHAQRRVVVPVAVVVLVDRYQNFPLAFLSFS